MNFIFFYQENHLNVYTDFLVTFKQDIKPDQKNRIAGEHRTWLKNLIKEIKTWINLKTTFYIHSEIGRKVWNNYVKDENTGPSNWFHINLFY